MQSAVIYARVSSREQEREGYSIPAQRKLLNEYARVRDFRVQQEFIDVESAKNPGRKEFGAMLRLLETDPQCRRSPRTQAKKAPSCWERSMIRRTTTSVTTP